MQKRSKQKQVRGKKNDIGSYNSSAKPDTKALAARLLELRRKHGYTQADVAAAIDIHQGTYSNYERGKNFPGSATLRKIAAFYGLTADDLMELCLPLDPEVFFDAQHDSGAVEEMRALLEYKKSIRELSDEDLRLLFYFSGLSPAARREVIDFASFKRKRKG